jgi:TRAP-type C4-dicarboxylate transport system substrate-binding protein
VFLVVCSKSKQSSAQDEDSNDPAKGDPVKLMLGTGQAPDTYLASWLYHLAEIVSEKTNGRFIIEIYPSAQLGTDSEMVDKLSLGLADMMLSEPGLFQDFVPELAVFSAPFLFDSREEAQAATKPGVEPWATFSSQLIEKGGIRFLTACCYGSRIVTANKAIRNVSDGANVKMRVFTMPIAYTYAESFGCTPVPVAWAEVPTALATGTVSAQENPSNVVLAAGLYDLQKYLMATNHVQAIDGILISEISFQKLSPKDQRILLDASAETREWAFNQLDTLEKSSLDQLASKGMTIISQDQMDISGFKEAAKASVMKSFGNVWGPVYEQIASMDYR